MANEKGVYTCPLTDYRPEHSMAKDPTSEVDEELPVCIFPHEADPLEGVFVSGEMCTKFTAEFRGVVQAAYQAGDVKICLARLLPCVRGGSRHCAGRIGRRLS